MFFAIPSNDYTGLHHLAAILNLVAIPLAGNPRNQLVTVKAVVSPAHRYSHYFR